MSKHHLKLLIWAALVGLVFLLLVAGLRGLGAAVSSVNKGANPETALHIVPNVPPDLQVALTWTADDPDTGRALEPNTRDAVQSAYLRAWLQWNLSFQKGEPFGLKTYFTGPALEAIDASVTRAASDGLRVEQADTAHELQLHLYAADGSLVTFTDRRAVVAQVIRDAAGNPIYAGETWATYDVVMVAEDGNWAVRHWARRDSSVPSVPAVANDAGFVRADGPALSVDGADYRIAGINYYPRDTPWDRFWPDYDPTVIDHDFGVIRGLGLNTVRIFVPYGQFGGPAPNPAYLDKLDDLLARARANGLRVIVTLFDFRVDYRLLSWPPDDRHLEGLIPRFAANPTILAWDLKNEPDRDYGAGQDNVQAWLRHEALIVRRLDPNHLLTVGWSNPAAAGALADELDLVSFHYYGLAADLPAAYASLRAAAPNRPIALGEFGLPTWNSPLFPNGHSEREQAAYYADVLTALRATDGAGYLAWTLYDFTSVPAFIAGRFPWETGPQRQLGVIRTDGTAKPAAALLAPGASLDVPRVPAYARVFKPFWLLFLGCFLTASAVGLLLMRWCRRRWRPRRIAPSGPSVPLPPPAGAANVADDRAAEGRGADRSNGKVLPDEDARGRRPTSRSRRHRGGGAHSRR